MAFYRRRGNKHNNVKVKANGRVYDSKAEYEYRLILDELKSNGYIKEIDEQYKMPIDNIPYNGQLLYNEKARKLEYRCDFRVVDWKDRIHYIETKGFLETTARVKMAYIMYVYGIFIQLVPTKGINKFNTSFITDKKIDEKFINKI